MDKEIDVVAAVIVQGNMVLAARRGKQMSLANLWEFPGGKIEPNETPEHALLREIEEEFGCVIEVGPPVTRTRHAYEFGIVRLSTYYAFVRSGHPEPLEHSELRWCTAAELDELDWAPADVPAARIVAALVRGARSFPLEQELTAVLKSDPEASGRNIVP